MPITLTTHANEESTFVVTVAFTDTTGAAVTPNNGLNWTLTDTRGNVVNSRSAVSITPGASVTIVLSGDDLALPSALYGRDRVLTVQGTYDSDLGNALPLKEQIVFTIDDLTAVT